MICSDDPRAQAMRPAGPVLEEARHAFAFVAPEPFPDGRGRNTYGAGHERGVSPARSVATNQELRMFGVVLAFL